MVQQITSYIRFSISFIIPSACWTFSSASMVRTFISGFELNDKSSREDAYSVHTTSSAIVTHKIARRRQNKTKNTKIYEKKEDHEKGRLSCFPIWRLWINQIIQRSPLWSTRHLCLNVLLSSSLPTTCSYFFYLFINMPINHICLVICRQTKHIK